MRTCPNCGEVVAGSKLIEAEGGLYCPRCYTGSIDSINNLNSEIAEELEVVRDIDIPSKEIVNNIVEQLTDGEITEMKAKKELNELI